MKMYNYKVVLPEQVQKPLDSFCESYNVNTEMKIGIIMMLQGAMLTGTQADENTKNKYEADYYNFMNWISSLPSKEEAEAQENKK